MRAIGIPFTLLVPHVVDGYSFGLGGNPDLIHEVALR
jgi:hypothetical protein